MRPYGVKLIDGMDVDDIKSTGRASHFGKFAGRSGDYHPYNRNVAAKAATRRYWARLARREGRVACTVCGT